MEIEPVAREVRLIPLPDAEAVTGEPLPLSAVARALATELPVLVCP